MLKDLFVHVCIVITFLFIGGSIFRFFPYLYTFWQKLLFGTALGILGSLLMFFSIHLTPSVIMDYRHIAILISALYGGVISTIATVIIICFNRAVFFMGAPISILVSSLMMIIIGIFSIFISKTNLSELKKWIYMYSFSLVILSAGFDFLLGKTQNFYDIMVKYWAISIASGLILFYCVNYIIYSNRTYFDMKKQSTTDFLTGLNNVRQFYSAFHHSIEKANKHDEKLSLLMIDIDHFKNINDTYGHQTGDSILKQMGDLLFSCCRSFDIPSRMGGDEFSLLLLNCTNQQAIEISERIRHCVEKHDFKITDDKFLKFTVSIGVSTYLETTYYPERIIHQADTALYKAKHAGKNKVCTSMTN